MPTKGPDIPTAVHQLARLLELHGLTMLTAESCTGGMLATVCTDRAGSSAWFEGAIVSYSNQLKQTLLGVNATTLQHYGAVSEQTAREMALGALRHSAAQVSIATTGIAGPSGGVAGKPVGTVCFGYVVGEAAYTETQYFSGGRDEVRTAATLHALNTLINHLKLLG